MPLLLALCLIQAKAPDRPLQGPAAKCGSEIPWTTSLEAAQAKSKETGRPILWWVPSLAGSPMDRKLVLEKYMLAGPWMMPAVVPLVRDHFVPLRLEGAPAHRDRFGLRPMETIEPVLLFLDPDFHVLHIVDRLTTFHEGWFLHLLRGVLAKAGRPAPGAARIDDPGEALWRKGAELHRAGRDEEGRAEWRKIVEGRWAWKAAAELAGDGPFVRGFEVEEAVAPEGLPSTTTLPARDPDVGRAVKFLVGVQRSSGAWTDSHYNFGGDDSLPNVWMAVTALAALALRDIDDPAAKGAVERAEKYMRDESRIAADDTDEIAWAHAYRLLYFAKDADMRARLVKKLADLQLKHGGWAHEYDNPFVTATVLHALIEAREAGGDVPKAVIDRGSMALWMSRDRRGLFGYDFSRPGTSFEGGAGRMPFCEYVLHRAGRSSADAVKKALEVSFKHHGLLERVRKYDDHADRHGNGGFFFWYDQLGRAWAARAANDGKAAAFQREIVRSTQEIDGCWVDSHELGRVYGTAMALLTWRVSSKF